MIKFDNSIVISWIIGGVILIYYGITNILIQKKYKSGFLCFIFAITPVSCFIPILVYGFVCLYFMFSFPKSLKDFKEDLMEFLNLKRN